jgi:hypothetical protein
MLTAKKLTRGNIKPVSSVFVDHGKINISELNWMTMTIVNCPSVYIDKAQALRITSSISKINVNEIGSLVCDSKSDSYNIKSINNFMIEGVYSTFDTGLLKSQLKAKSLYGTINIQEISNYFRLIDITGGQTFISLRPVADCSFKADVLTTDAEAVFPSQKYPGIERTSSNYTTTLKGFTGADKESKSQITIRATGGKVTFK